jgi:hypothetical protein
VAHVLMMVNAHPLLPEVIEEGRRLVKAVRNSGITITAALWMYETEPERWRLMLISPSYDRADPLDAYSALSAVVDSMNPPIRFDVTAVSFMRLADRRRKALRRFLKSNVRDSDTVIEGASLEGQYVEAMYFYPLEHLKK